MENTAEAICLVDDARDVFLRELLQKFLLDSLQNSLKEIAMLTMASRTARQLVLRSVETLDFSYLSWFNMCTSPCRLTTQNYRWGFVRHQSLRFEWGKQRCLSFACHVANMPKLKYLDLSGLILLRQEVRNRLYGAVGASAIHTLKIRGWLDDEGLIAMLKHPSGALAGALKSLDISNCDRITPSTAAPLIVELCPQLEELIWFLQSYRYTEVSKHLVTLIEGLPKLRKLVAPAFGNIWVTDISWIDQLKTEFDLLGVSAARNNGHSPTGINDFLEKAAPHVKHLRQIAMPSNTYLSGTPVLGTYAQYLLFSTNKSLDAVYSSIRDTCSRLNLSPPSNEDFSSEGVLSPLVECLINTSSPMNRFDELLKAGFDPFEPAYSGLNALALAAMDNHWGHFFKILEVHGQGNLPRSAANHSKMGFNLLHVFALWGKRRAKHLWILEPENLKRCQMDINAQDLFGWTPLHYAVLADSRKLTADLLKLGASSNLRGFYGDRDTACKLAIRNGCGPRLLERLLHPDLLEEWASNEPHWALCAVLLMNRKKNLRRLILGRINRPRQVISAAEAVFPLALAAIRSSDSLFGYLLTQIPYFFDCIDISKHYDAHGLIGVRGGTALHLAVAQNRPNTVKMLLNKGASACELDELEQTPLIIGVRQRACLELVPLLLQHMLKSPESINQAGNEKLHTVLHWASRLSVPDAPGIIRALLQFPGVKADAQDKKGRTPLDMCKSTTLQAVFAEFGIAPENLH